MKDFANWNSYFESEFLKIPPERRKKPSVFLSVVPEKQVWTDFVDFLRQEWRYGRITEFPYCLITLYSGVAFFEYKNKKFWQHFADTVASKIVSKDQIKLNEYFSYFADEIGLEMLDNQRGNDFVGSAIYQIGVPLSLWQDFLRICESLWWKDNWQSFSTEEWDEFVNRKVHGLQRLKRFLVENPNTSRKFIEEVHDARRLIGSGEIGIEEIAQISFLRPEHFEEVPETAEFLHPYNPELLFKNRFHLIWNESDAKISVYLPPVKADELPATWKLNDLEVKADLYQHEFEINSLAFQPKISLQLETVTKIDTKKLKGIENWALFENDSGRLVNTDRKSLPLKSYTLLSLETVQTLNAKGFDETDEQVFELKDGSICYLNRLVPLEQKGKFSFTVQEEKFELDFRAKGKVEIFLLSGFGEKAAQFRLFENTLKTTVLPVPCLTLPLGLFDEDEVNLAEKFKVSLDEREIVGVWEKIREDNYKEVYIWQWDEETKARKNKNLIIECKNLAIRKEFKIEILQEKDNLTECWANMPNKFLPFVLLAQPNFKSDSGTTFDELREIKEIIAPNERFVGMGFFYYYSNLGVLKCSGNRWEFARSKLYSSENENFDAKMFLPTSRLPDGKLSTDEKKNLWLAETFAYFGIPDSARESVEDLGLATVEYEIKKTELREFNSIIGTDKFSLEESHAALQTLFAELRHQKAFTLPKGKVAHDDIAFGRVIGDIYYAEKSQNNAKGWLPKNKNRDVYTTDYLKRLCKLSIDENYELAEKIWKFLTDKYILHPSPKNSELKKLSHEQLYLKKAENRYVCNRCAYITTFSAKNVCPKKGCVGSLEEKPFDPNRENLIARWVSGKGTPQFYTLKSEEHTAQIDKNYAKQIEDDFSGKTKKATTENGEEKISIEGVNLLSSTTTFEMGINIGDLQKVLLRNAPPSSANYVQRVGRAGRGKDKNAICVTLCKRTKYDADAWKNPSQRLMTGEIKPPTVFIENRFIAQRHFNAVVFAQFLREKIVEEKLLSEIKQKTPLAPFLSPESRKNIPAGWLRFYPTDAYLDFVEWLENQTESEIFNTAAKKDLLKAIKGFDEGKKEARNQFVNLIKKVSDEVSAFIEERGRLFGQGFSTKSIEDSTKNLLDNDVIGILAKRGFLPRYAFPLDVVSLETSLSRWANDSDVELSRDRALAIAEFAPGSQVIARKKVFTSAGLYIASRSDKPDVLFYAKCPECSQIKTARFESELEKQCEVCTKIITRQHIGEFVEPQAFTIKLGEKETRSQRHRKSSFVRQRQSTTHFIDVVKESEFEDSGMFKIALKDDGKLFRYNLGLKGEGFVICDRCGFSHFKKNFKSNQKHDRIRNIGKTNKCENKSLLGYSRASGLAFGHQFESFCLIVRPQENLTNPELKLSLANALHKGLCKVLETESSDIGVSGRGITNRQTISDENTEFVFFDKTPGGAGFVKEAKNNWNKIIAETLQICSYCDCQKVCYNCLKDYYNQSVHNLLDRNLVTDFLTG